MSVLTCKACRTHSALFQATGRQVCNCLGDCLENAYSRVDGFKDAPVLELLMPSDTSISGELVKSDAPISNPLIDEIITQLLQQEAKQVTTSQKKDLCNKDLEEPVVNPIQKIPVVNTVKARSTFSSVAHKAKRDIDQTSDSESDSVKYNSRIPVYSKVPVGKRLTKPKQTDCATVTQKMRSSKQTLGTRNRASSVQSSGSVESEKTGPKSIKAVPTEGLVHSQEETYRAIVEERDIERERRWKAEQAVNKLTVQVKDLQSRASEEKDLQSVAAHTTDRLKELLLKERSDRTSLQTQLEELQDRHQSTLQQIERSRSREDQHKRALQTLEDKFTQANAVKMQQHVEEMVRTQELENKSFALKREVDILRASARKYKEKLQQLHEVMNSREDMHRKELATRLLPGGSEFKEAVNREVNVAEQRFTQRRADLEQKITDAHKQYAALEDEFRLALTIEAKRFAEVKEGFDRIAAELMDVKSCFRQSQQIEKKSASLVKELTVMVKEQKKRIAELLKAKLEANAKFKSMESRLEEDKQHKEQVELLKKEKSELSSQLSAQESVLDGLRTERKLWRQELAEQGSALAQDRGRMEAKIESLLTELESLKKQNEGHKDSVKINAKIIDDQRESIHKLKEALLERDGQIRKLQDENLQDGPKLKQQLEYEMAKARKLEKDVEWLTFRKEELKQQILDKEAQFKETLRALIKKEKMEVLSRFEGQVKRMKENFDSKEKALINEMDKASQAHRLAVEKLHCVANVFRMQLESLHASHQKALFKLATEKEKQVESANQKVFNVEEEMRHLLEETESKKKDIG